MIFFKSFIMLLIFFIAKGGSKNIKVGLISSNNLLLRIKETSSLIAMAFSLSILSALRFFFKMEKASKFFSKKNTLLTSLDRHSNPKDPEPEKRSKTIEFLNSN